MSNSSPYQQAGDPPCDLAEKPKSSTEPHNEDEISPLEGVSEDEEVEKGGTRGYDGGRADEQAGGNQPVKGGYLDALARSRVEAVEECGGDGGRAIPVHGGDENDDDGYRTPTSPARRIPIRLPCPPAPRKISAKKRWRKRKTREEESHNSVRRRLQLPDDLELVFISVVGSKAAIQMRKVAG